MPWHTVEGPSARMALNACLTKMRLTTAPPSSGLVSAVRGAVVDVVFAEANLPHLNSALVAEWDTPTPLVLEVHSHLNLSTLRAVAFQSTAGLARGVTVRVLGSPVAVPVGNAVLGRVLVSWATHRTTDLCCPVIRPDGRSTPCRRL